MISSILRNLQEWEEDFFSFLDEDLDEGGASTNHNTHIPDNNDPGVFHFESTPQTQQSESKHQTDTITLDPQAKGGETIHKNFDTGQVLSAILTMTKVRLPLFTDNLLIDFAFAHCRFLLVLLFAFLSSYS